MPLSRLPFLLASGLALATSLVLPAAAQTDAGACIVTGRITAEQRWAPRFAGVSPFPLPSWEKATRAKGPRRVRGIVQCARCLSS